MGKRHTFVIPTLRRWVGRIANSRTHWLHNKAASNKSIWQTMGHLMSLREDVRKPHLMPSSIIVCTCTCVCIYILVCLCIWRVYMHLCPFVCGERTQYVCDKRKCLGFSSGPSSSFETTSLCYSLLWTPGCWPKSICGFSCSCLSLSHHKKARTEDVFYIRLPCQRIYSLDHFQVPTFQSL